MSNINAYSLQAELAQAAYGAFLDKTIAIDDLTNPSVGMSTSQATTFAARWQVAAQYSDPNSGASATVFEAKEGGALERFNPDAGTGMITDEYLSDRINFLEREMWFNTQDKNPYNTSTNSGTNEAGYNDKHIFEKESRYFEDAASGYKIQQGGLFLTHHATSLATIK